MQNKPFVTRYELFVYFLLTFCLSWIFWIPGALFFISKGKLFSPLTILVQTIGAAGPSIVALWFVRYRYGKDAVDAIFSRYKKWRVGARWLLLACLLIPAITILAILVNVLCLRVPVAPNSILGSITGRLGFFALFLFPVLFVSQLISSPLLEEFGWRGFALPKLQERYSALVSGLVLGAVWGIWHLPLWLAFGVDLPVTLLLIVAHSVIMTWMFNNTEGSMFIALLAHASMNVSLTFLASGHARWIELIAAWIVVLALVKQSGTELRRQESGL
jgi:membrane protease YdiL (CAAX protease family)